MSDFDIDPNECLRDIMIASGVVPFYTGVEFPGVGKVIFVDGAFLVLDRNCTMNVYRYALDGTYTGFSFSVIEQTVDPANITLVGDHLYITCGHIGDIFQYTKGGIYTGIIIHSNRMIDSFEAK